MVILRVYKTIVKVRPEGGNILDMWVDHCWLSPGYLDYCRCLNPVMVHSYRYPVPIFDMELA